MPLAMVCYGKRRRNLSSAQREQKSRNNRGGDVRRYECPVCSSWHLGTARSDAVDGCAVAKPIVRALRAAGYGWYLGQLANDWDPKYVDRDSSGVWRMKVGT
jgi:hypothetical protein